MKETIIKTTVLEASEGMTITDKEYTLFAKIIYLGSNDSPDNYFEITDEEAAKLTKDKEEIV